MVRYCARDAVKDPGRPSAVRPFAPGEAHDGRTDWPVDRILHLL